MLIILLQISNTNIENSDALSFVRNVQYFPVWIASDYFLQFF